MTALVCRHFSVDVCPAHSTHIVSSESPGSESDCKAEQGNGCGGKTGEAKIVAAEQCQVVVKCPDCTEARYHGIRIDGWMGKQLRLRETPHTGQRRRVVKALPEDVEILHDLPLKRPLVAELIDILAKEPLRPRDTEVVLITESQRQGVVEEQIRAMAGCRC